MQLKKIRNSSGRENKLLIVNQRASFTVSVLLQICFRSVSGLFLFPFCFISVAFQIEETQNVALIMVATAV